MLIKTANDAPIHHTPLLTNGIERNTLLPINNTDEYIALRVTDEF
jgi:hypothetical protein